MKAGQAAEIDGKELVVPEGLERGAQEYVREIESRDEQEADHYHVAEAAFLRGIVARDGGC